MAFASNFLSKFGRAFVAPAAFAAISLFIFACEGMGSFGAPAERTEPRTQPADEIVEEPPKSAMEASEYIDASGGSLRFRNCTLTVPKNAVRERLYFSVKALSDDPEDAIAIKATSYSILPSGTMFNTPAVLSIGYDAGTLTGFSAEDLILVRMIEGVWREVGKSKVDLNKQTVSVPITLSGTFALARRDVSRRKVNDVPQAMFDIAYMPLDDGRMRVEYDANKSEDPDGRIVKYDWDFDGDGIFDYSSRESAAASYVFDTIGRYTTVLKVTDNGISPKSSVETKVIEVDELFPPDTPKRLDMNISTFPPGGNVPVAVNFAASAVGGLDPYIVLWDFGKGKTADVFNPTYRFDNPGTHKVFVYLADHSGQEIAREVTLNIRDKAPQPFEGKPFRLSMLAGKEKGRAPLNVDFTLKFENAKEPVRWKFEFGDEGERDKPQIGQGKSASHTYTQPGTYVARIIATDANQNVDTSFLVIAVDPTDTREDRPKVRIDAAERFAAREGRITAAAYANRDDSREFTFALHGLSDAELRTVNWNFGDGFHSTDPGAVYKYEKDGIFEAVATFGSGIAMKERRIWLPVGDAPAAAIQLPEEVKALAPFTLSPTALAAGLEGTLTYEWDFGDGAASTDARPVNTYTSSGTYELTVKVTDGKGEKFAEAAPVTLRVYPRAESYAKNVAIIGFLEATLGKSAKALYLVSSPDGERYELPAAISDRPDSFLSMSPGCGFIAHSSDRGFAVTDTNSGLTVFELKPRDGVVTGAFITRFGEDILFNVRKDSGARSAYLNSAHFGLISLTPEGENAEVAALSADGDTILIRHWAGEEADAVLSMAKRSSETGDWSKPEEIAKGVRAAAVSADGSNVLVMHTDRSVFEISPRLDEPGQVTGSEMMKAALQISDDGGTAAWLEDAGGGEWNAVIARRTDRGFLAIENLSDAMGIKVSAISLFPDASSAAFYAIAEVIGDEDNGDNSATNEGIFICDLNAESYLPKFLTKADKTFASGVRAIRN